MTDVTRQRLCLLALTALAAGVFLTGIGWGLPSRAADPYLFGDRRPWTGAEILQLAGGRDADPHRGADVALHPIEDRSQVVALNETDRQRAEIVRRYRLFTYQPDEMLTLMSLAGMKPRSGDLDPRLYQYGGLFIYPVGAALKAAALLHLIDLKSDLSYYLDHPEAFGRFYVVARCTVAFWGIVGVWVVFHLARRLTTGLIAPTMAALGYLLMPVVINMSYEAKPHLPGAVLMLLTVLAADSYVRTGSRRWALLTGAIAGAATGMVISSVLIFCVLPLMTWLRNISWRQRIAITLLAGLSGILVYGVTNPYVPINLIRNRTVLRSNFGNSTNMYHVGGLGGGIPNAIHLLGEGASPLVALIGLIAAILTLRHLRGTARSPLAILLAVPAGLQCLQFFSLAAGKPGEYGRFAIFLDVVLLLSAIAAIARLRRGSIAGMLALVLSIGVFGARYLIGFVRDCRPITSRLIAAEKIRADLDSGSRSIAIWMEPAPYSLPPVDLFRSRLLLQPRGPEANPAHGADLLIPPADAGVLPFRISRGQLSNSMAPRRNLPPPAISWADRTFYIVKSIDLP